MNHTISDRNTYTTVNGDSRTGIEVDLSQIEGYKYLNGSTETVNGVTGTSFTYKYKIVFGVTPDVGQTISYFNQFEGKNMKVEPVVTANTTKFISFWDDVESIPLNFKNAHVDPDSPIFSIIKDDIAPIGTVSYSNNKYTEDPVTVTINTNEPIKDISGWTKVNDTTFTKVYTYNTPGAIYIDIEDLAGNQSTVRVNVHQIYNYQASCTITYTPAAGTITNADVEARIKCNKPLNAASFTTNGWTYIGDLEYKKIYSYNSAYIPDVEVTPYLDFAGHAISVSTNIDWIDKAVPIIKIEDANKRYIYDVGTSLATILPESLVGVQALDCENKEKCKYDGSGSKAPTDITSRINVTHNINTAVAGRYYFKYTVTDVAGNVSLEYVKEIIIKTPDICFSGLWYNTANDGYHITAYNKELPGCEGPNLVIPDEINGAKGIKKVLYIDDSTKPFNGKNFTGNLTILSSSLKIITPTTFQNNSFNDYLVLPDNIEEIGNAAFADNHFVGELKLPANLKKVGTFVFTGSKFTGDLIIPNSVTSIDTGGFMGVFEDGKSLIISSNLAEISQWAFANNKFTGDLIIPNSVTTIKADAFSTSKANSFFNGKLTLSNSLVEIGPGAFYGNKFNQALYIPDSVTTMGTVAFSETYIGTVSAPASLVIPENAFPSWTSITRR